MTHILKGHVSKVTDLKFINARVLVSASTDQTIRTWDTMVYKIINYMLLIIFNRLVYKRQYIKWVDKLIVYFSLII
jgi:hypothetical protein